MLNKFPLWKNLLILLMVVLSAIYALPNFYPDDPAVQISHDSGQVDQAALDTALQALRDDGIAYKEAAIEDGVALIRLTAQPDQTRAQQLVNLALSRDYVVALNLAPNTPKWLLAIGAKPMSYGLDLQGGVHFLMEVDLEQAIAKQLNDTAAVMRNLMREERIRYRPPLNVDAQNRIVLRFADAETRTAASARLRTEFPDLQTRTEQAGQDFLLYFNMTEASILQLQTYAVQQNLTTLRSRVNELGVKEPKIQQSGINRIVIELPGIQDTTRAKDLIAAVATLQFHLVAGPNTLAGDTVEYPYNGVPYRLDANVIVSGESVTSAQTSIDPQTTLPQVNITLDAAGARRLNEVTRVNIQNSMAILLSETKTRNETVRGADGELSTVSRPYAEERLISVATIQSALGRQFRITGLEAKEAGDLALLIRSGALAAPMHFVEESTVGPSLGQENIENGVNSVLAGLAAIFVFMILVYRVCGFIANVALFANILMIMALMSIIGATLTLPGIAGIVLTMAVAVDANVLIYARIGDELTRGMKVARAIDAGYDRAFITILDSNLTILIVAVILYSVGTGPIKGFAVTTAVGIVTSMVTAILISRAIVNVVYGSADTKYISIGMKMPETASA
ncbi:MAG: protein translocase subunit SecD [Pseudomonadales bacterium]|jgi:preprotein translocase subunit SecD|nr:protein translocase subunit SecD [Pseudomonadales bacterium]